MTKIVLNPVVGTYGASLINQNFDALKDALDNKVLFRDNPDGNANEMKKDLDMNSHRILNLPAPIGPNEPARKADILSMEQVSQAVVDSQAAADRAEAVADVLQGKKEVVSVKDFGAKVDGIADDAAAVQAAIASAITKGATLVAGGGTIRIDSDVNFRNAFVNFADTSIVCYNGAKVVIGGDARQINPPQAFYKISRSGGVTSTPTCRVMGAKMQTIGIEFCDYLQLYADTSTGNSGPDYSIAYSTFNLGQVNKLEFDTNASTPNSLTQWINENTFNSKRITTLIVKGTYSHNHNMFKGGCFEAGSIDFQTGNNNQIMEARFESGCSITFGAGTWGNRIVRTWGSNQRVSYEHALIGITVTNNGDVGNQVLSAAHFGQRRIPLLQVTPATCKTFTAYPFSSAGSYEYPGNISTLEHVDVGALGIDSFTTTAFRKVFGDPTLIPVGLGDAVEFQSDATLFRPRFYIYDANGVQITNSDPQAATYLRLDPNTAWNSTFNCFSSSVNLNGALAIVNSPVVKFIRVEIQTGNATDNQPFKYLGVHLITTKTDPVTTSRSLMQQRMAQVPDTPARGFAPRVGTVVSLTTGGFCQASFARDTTLSGTSASGEGTVSLTNVTGVASGDVIGITLSDGSVHWTIVTGLPSAGVVSLGAALPSAAAIGGRVVVNRWVKFNKAASQADSSAVDVAALKADFNSLLAKLRASGLLSS